MSLIGDKGLFIITTSTNKKYTEYQINPNDGFLISQLLIIWSH